MMNFISFFMGSLGKIGDVSVEFDGAVPSFQFFHHLYFQTAAYFLYGSWLKSKSHFSE
jgi:hypothetical protein